MDLTKGNISKNLILFSIPIVLTLMSSIALSLSDQIIVARCLGQNALATISSINGIVGLAYILLHGFSSSLTIIASKAFKNRETLEKNKVFASGIFLSLLSSLVFMIIFIGLSDYWVKILHVPSVIINDASYCLKIYGFSFIFMMFIHMFSSLFQGFNDSRTPMIIQISMNILNILLDLLFLYVFHCSVEYAVYASLISSMIGSIFMYCIFQHHYHLDRHVSLQWDYLKHVLVLSLSMMLQESIMNICGMLICTKVNTLGITAINLNTACENIQNFYILIFIGLSNAFTVFIGTHYSIKSYQRILDGVKSMMQIGFILFIFVSILCILTYPSLLRLYIQDLDPFSKHYSTFYMIAMIISLLAYLIKYMIDGFMKTFENMKEFIMSSFINLFGRCLIFYMLVPYLGLYSLPIALIISIYLSMIYNLYYYLKKYLPMLKK